MKYYIHTHGSIWITDGINARCIYTISNGILSNITSNNWTTAASNIYDSYNYKHITKEEAFLEML